jgi:cytidylate kinase
VSLSFDEVLADVGKRDIEDAQRDYGVAGIPADSVEVDTTDMTLEQQVDHIVDLARQRGA